MDSTNQEEVKQEVIVTPVDEIETQQPKPRRNWLKILYLIFLGLLFIAIITLTLWLVQVFTVYNNAISYKEAYDIVQEQIVFCDKIKGTSQKQEIFNYCDQFNERFKVIERDAENN